MADVSMFLVALAVLLLVYAAVHDVAVRTVPNWISGLILLSGVGLRIADHSLLTSLAAVLVLFLFLFGVWLAGLMGGGDVKLWAASAFLVPPSWQAMLFFVANTLLIGGILAVVYILMSFVVPSPAASRAGSCFRRFLRAERWRISRRAALPYACAIAGGVCTVLFPRIFQT